MFFLVSTVILWELAHNSLETNSLKSFLAHTMENFLRHGMVKLGDKGMLLKALFTWYSRELGYFLLFLDIVDSRWIGYLKRSIGLFSNALLVYIV